MVERTAADFNIFQGGEAVARRIYCIGNRFDAAAAWRGGGCCIARRAIAQARLVGLQGQNPLIQALPQG